jgi:hypothetical protein
MSADLQDDLHAEIMTEMAENFFSRRRNLEDSLDQFYRLVVRVRRVGMAALVKWHTLFRLLLCDDTAKRLFESLGAVPADILWYCKNVNRNRADAAPLGPDGLGRYVKQWNALREGAQPPRTNIHGSSLGTPWMLQDARHPRISPGQGYVSGGQCRDITVNEGQSPYSVLAFASLDPEGLQRETIAGAPLSDTQKIDRDLAFVPIAFEDLGLPHIPELPPLSEVRDRLKGVCRNLLRTRKDEVEAMLEQVWAA